MTGAAPVMTWMLAPAGSDVVSIHVAAARQQLCFLRESTQDQDPGRSSAYVTSDD